MCRLPGLACDGVVGQFNIITLIADSFGLVGASSGCSYKVYYVTLSLGSGFFGVFFCLAGYIGILQKT